MRRRREICRAGSETRNGEGEAISLGESTPRERGGGELRHLLIGCCYRSGMALGEQRRLLKDLPSTQYWGIPEADAEDLIAEGESLLEGGAAPAAGEAELRRELRLWLGGPGEPKVSREAGTWRARKTRIARSAIPSPAQPVPYSLKVAQRIATRIHCRRRLRRSC